MMKRARAAGLFFAAMLASGCDDNGWKPRKSVETLSGANVVREHDPQKVAMGHRVYTQHCANCHGVNGEGASDWRKRDADGFYPPPPLDGSGHAWHHPTVWLHDMIRDGSPPGQGRMPAWGGTLSDEEIGAVIEWFQSTWPDPVYAAWWDMQQRSFGKSR